MKTEHITEYDAWIKRLEELYPPPHNAVQIAKETQAILSAAAKKREKELLKALKAMYEAYRACAGFIHCLPSCIDDCVGDAGMNKIEKAERLYEKVTD